MESQLWLFISGGQLPGGTTGPCAAEVLLKNSNKGSLKSSQSPLMWRAKGWPSSAPLPEWFYPVVISPYWVSSLLLPGFRPGASSPAHVQVSDSWEQWSLLCPGGTSARSSGVQGISPWHCRFHQRQSALLPAARVWSFAGSSKLRMGSPISVTFCSLFQISLICSWNCELNECTLP